MKASRRREAARTLLYLVSAIPLGTLGFAVLVAGWTLTLSLSFTPLVVPVLVAFRAATGWVARAEATLANRLLGVSTRPRVASPGRPGYWRRAANVLGDRTFWKQQAFLLQRFVLGSTLAVSELTLVAAGAGAVALPVYFSRSDFQIGAWHVDTLGRSLVLVPAGIAALGLAPILIGPLAALSRVLAAGLLGGEGAEESQRLPEVARRLRLRSLALHAATVGVPNLLFVLTWAVTSRGYFWPEWTLIPFGTILALHAWAVFVDERPDLVRAQRLTRGLVMHAGVSSASAVFLVLVWAVTSRGYFWPIWPVIVLGAFFAMHLAVILARRDQERIGVLETTRAGAVGQQEAELRRIERDLHDGAQARLVALGMSLGMAEQKLASDPEAAKQLLADARRGAHEALEELRDLARGIHPPVLADRGLEAAVSALADRTPLRANVAVDVGKRPAPPVESAAYFIVAEALANTGKHANAEAVDITIRREGDELIVEIVDDGDGGADPSGNGLGGLARRVEALDGTLVVTSPPGGPTSLRVVMPCGS